MELLAISLSVLALLLLVCLAAAVFFLLKGMERQQTKNLSYLSSTAQIELERERERTKRDSLTSELLSKALALLASGDPLAYQQVQAMEIRSAYNDDEFYDPSDDAEMEKIRDRNANLDEQEDDVNGLERSLFAELAGNGIDPAAFYDLRDTNGTSPI